MKFIYTSPYKAYGVKNIEMFQTEHTCQPVFPGTKKMVGPYDWSINSCIIFFGIIKIFMFAPYSGLSFRFYFGYPRVSVKQ
jgi:hypothetical protein